MNKKVICLACGSASVERCEVESFRQLIFGFEYSFKEIFYKCNSCSEEGDFLNETEANYLESKKNAQIQMMKKIINNLNDHNITMAMFERVFDLPARTLTRWKNGDFSSSAVALLSIVATYPWIIEVAENYFNPSFAAFSLINAAVKKFEDESKKNLNAIVRIL